MSTASKSGSRSRYLQQPPLYSVPARGAIPIKTDSRPRRQTQAADAAAFSKAGVGTVRRLPSPRKLPIWLQLMLLAQRGSLVVTFILVMGALLVYGNTVYTQQLWSKNFRDLRAFQRSERQLAAATGMLQSQVAQQAERPDSGLVLQKPANMIFLQPAPQRHLPEAAPIAPAPAIKAPLGY